MIYKIIKQAISQELAEFVYAYFLNKRAVAKHLFETRYISPFTEYWGIWNDEQIPDTYSHYADIAMETLLENLKPLMEKESGLKLNETYSYARIYKKGDVLERHKDRYSCEVSTTLNIGGDEWPIYLEPSGEEGKEGTKIILNQGDVLERHKDRYSCEVSTTLNIGGDEWPIYLEPSGEEGKEGTKIILNQGDMLIYKGCDVEHWREAFEGENCGQVFLHYNDASDEKAEQNKYDGRPCLGLPAWFK